MNHSHKFQIWVTVVTGEVYLVIFLTIISESSEGQIHRWNRHCSCLPHKHHTLSCFCNFSLSQYDIAFFSNIHTTLDSFCLGILVYKPWIAQKSQISSIWCGAVILFDFSPCGYTYSQGIIFPWYKELISDTWDAAKTGKVIGYFSFRYGSSSLDAHFMYMVK